MKNIVIGRYIPGNTFLYKMDPRTKIIALIILMVSVFIIRSFTFMLGSLGIIIIVLLIGKISVKRVYLGLRPLMFLLIFTFVFQILFNTQGELLIERTLYYTLYTIPITILIITFWIFTKRYIRFKLLYFLLVLTSIVYVLTTLDLGYTIGQGELSIYSQGVEMAFFIMIRLIIIVTLSTILTLTTKPTDLNLGLESVLKPLKIFRVNTEEIAMILAISLRYIPTLLDEANKIMLAQASRGVDFSEGKLKDKVMQIVSLLVPMFIISFKRSDDLANAMEARSFVPGRPRTRLQVLKWTRLDTITLGITFIALITSISLRIFL